MKRPPRTFCFTWNLFFLVNFCIADDPLFAPRIIDTRHNIQCATINHRVVAFFFCRLDLPKNSVLPFLGLLPDCCLLRTQNPSSYPSSTGFVGELLTVLHRSSHIFCDFGALQTRKPHQNDVRTLYKSCFSARWRRLNRKQPANDCCDALFSLLFASPSTISTNTLGNPVSVHIAIKTACRHIGFACQIR